MASCGGYMDMVLPPQQAHNSSPNPTLGTERSFLVPGRSPTIPRSCVRSSNSTRRSGYRQIRAAGSSGTRLHGPGSVGVRAHALHPTDGDLRELVKKATDGSVNIFVDAGANIGVHTRFLFEPAKYPRSHFTKVFLHAFGAVSNETAQLTCSLGLEPNPKHITRHKALQHAYKRMGWRGTASSPLLSELIRQRSLFSTRI